jgi:hypothetical protein
LPMPSLSFSQAKSLFAKYISYIGPTDSVVADAINFVNERFITSGQWKGNRFVKSFTCSLQGDGTYCFDTGVESVLKAIAINDDGFTGDIADVMGDWFPFSEASLGYVPPSYVGDTQIIRIGQTPVSSTAFPAVSWQIDCHDDTSGSLQGKQIKIAGTTLTLGATGNIVFSSGSTGTVVAAAFSTWATANKYTNSVVGNTITISSESPTFTVVDVNSGLFIEQASLDASANLTPTQRYRVIGKVPEDRVIYCLVRRGYVPLVNDNDLLFPSNRNAYRYGVQAYNYENTNELERAQVYWNAAFQCLNDETDSFEDGEEAQVEIQTKAFSPSLIQNLV